MGYSEVPLMFSILVAIADGGLGIGINAIVSSQNTTRAFG